MGWEGYSEARPLLSIDRGQILPPEFQKTNPPWEEYPLVELISDGEAIYTLYHGTYTDYLLGIINKGLTPFEELRGVPPRIFASPYFAGASDHTFATIPRDNFLKARGQYSRPKGEEAVLRMRIRKSWIESRPEALMSIDTRIRPEESIPEGTSRQGAFLTILQNSFHYPSNIGVTLPVDYVPPEMLEIFDKEKKQWLPIT